MNKDDRAKPGFHQMLVEGVPEAIIVSTPEGEITYFNPASERLLGYGAAEVTGKNITMLVPQQPGQRADPMKWLKRWAAEPEYEQSRYLDLIARRKDGREMPVDVRVVEARLDGAPRFLITFRDNTTRRQEQIAFKERNLLGKPLQMLLPERYRKAHLGEVSAFGRSRDASRWMSDRGPVTGLRKDGTEFPVDATITKVETGGRMTYTAHLRSSTGKTRRIEA
jgi:PAS domain S-box-containing protein